MEYVQGFRNYAGKYCHNPIEMSIFFKKTVILSLLGHMTVFSIFSFSFVDNIPKVNYTYVSFLGSILRDSDLSNPKPVKTAGLLAFNSRAHILALDRTNKEYALVFPQYLKPQAPLPLSEGKIIFMPKTQPIIFTQLKKEPVIMLHPNLPYHFLIYFKDRQRVHIELMFNIITKAMTSTILIKRKVSSGNLEADLLSMRYMNHYLFIQQSKFTPNKWQTVKIDLSAKDE